MSWRIAIDTGGTFTDVVVSEDEGELLANKAPTDLARGSRGVLTALEQICAELEMPVSLLLAQTDLLIYGTTRATNAILTGGAARTALLCTEGFPDTLTLREGGRLDPFDFATPFPPPYIPRALTFELPGRITSEGDELTKLDLDAAYEAALGIVDSGCQAIAVSLLWSTVNPAHELAVGELLSEVCPDVPFTLSHELNPITREYRRTSSAALDASLKPLMQEHFRRFAEDLREQGFAGEVLGLTSNGGCLPVDELVARPILSVDSGPTMAPVAARAYARSESQPDSVIVCDAGGTSFDVSLVRNGEIAMTRERWLGGQFQGHITGLSAVDVTSIGAGGGSIAWIDDGGLLRVGPASAGADPGPACYGGGGADPTVTDAALVLGYVDPEFFLGGRLALDSEAARSAITSRLAEPLGVAIEDAASAVMMIATEAMISAIREITVDQGVDPRECALVAGGGAGGLNAVEIAKALQCPGLLIPNASGTLSASGAQLAEVVTEFSASRVMSSASFDFELGLQVLNSIDQRIDHAAERLSINGGAGRGLRREYSIEARYPEQVWDIEVPLPSGAPASPDELSRVVEAFHDAHDRTFAVAQRDEAVEFQQWKGRLIAELPQPLLTRRARLNPKPAAVSATRAHFRGHGYVEIERYRAEHLAPGNHILGPALIEEETTTIVLPPGAAAAVTEARNLLIEVSP